MKYRVAGVQDFFAQVKKGNSYVEIPDVVSFTTPEVTPGSVEMKGAGLPGTYNVPDMSNIDAMESSITTSDDGGDAVLLDDVGGVEVVLNWAVGKIGGAEEDGYVSHRAVIKGRASVIPSGEIKKGEGLEYEHKLSVWFYKEEVDGVETKYIDLFAPKIRINGKDRLAKLNKALNK